MDNQNERFDENAQLNIEDQAQLTEDAPVFVEVNDTASDAPIEADAPEETVEAPEETVEAETSKTEENAPCNCEKSGSAARSVSNGHKIASSLFDTLEILVVSIVAVLLVFSFCFRLCRVSGGSMDTTLANGETLIISDLFYEPQRGDIVVFHLANKYYTEPLVKRVIAVGGDTVYININTGETYVNGKLIDEDYANFGVHGGYCIPDLSLLFDERYVDTNILGELIYMVKVPEGKIFVMGDNRNNSSDSRHKYVGFVDEDAVLGKALLRLSPFTPLS